MPETVEDQPSDEAPVQEIIVDYEGQCDSLTGRSVLTYQAGRHPESNTPMFRLLRNSGGGMFCRDWAPIAEIDAVLAKADPVTARSLNEVHPGRSTNTGGFLAAVAKDLGVIQAKEDNTRHHELVPGKTMLKALAERIAEAADANKSRRKGKPE